MMSRRLLACLLARLDASPLPLTDRVRLDLESELIARLAAAQERDGALSGTIARMGHLAEELRRLSLQQLRELAVKSGAVARFTAVMGGPPDLEGADAEDLISFIRENAP